MKPPAQRDWTRKRDEELTAHDIREMRSAANAARDTRPDPRRVPAMPATWNVTAAIRDLGTREIPVARLKLRDFTGDAVTVDLDEHTALGIAVDLLTFIRQVTANPLPGWEDDGGA